MAGKTDSSLDGDRSFGDDDVFLMKFDAMGVHQWTRQHGGSRSDIGRALQAARGGGIP